MTTYDNDLARRIIAGQRSKAAGEYFEEMIVSSLRWHEARGLLKAEKTPEPMKVIKPVGREGKFLACYTEKAQVDFCGTMRGGRAVRFEAKQTDTDRFERRRLNDKQMADLREHEKLGALCFVIVCFGVQNVYRIPWEIWDNMKEHFGRQYVKEADLKEFRIHIHSGVIKLLSGIIDVNQEGGTTWK